MQRYREIFADGLSDATFHLATFEAKYVVLQSINKVMLDYQIKAEARYAEVAEDNRNKDLWYDVQTKLRKAGQDGSISGKQAKEALMEFAMDNYQPPKYDINVTLH